MARVIKDINDYPGCYIPPKERMEIQLRPTERMLFDFVGYLVAENHVNIDQVAQRWGSLFTPGDNYYEGFGTKENYAVVSMVENFLAEHGVDIHSIYDLDQSHE